MRQQRHAISQSDHPPAPLPHSHACVTIPAQEKWASPLLSASVAQSTSFPWSFSLKLLSDELPHNQICRFLFFSSFSFFSPLWQCAQACSSSSLRYPRVPHKRVHGGLHLHAAAFYSHHTRPSTAKPHQCKLLSSSHHVFIPGVFILVRSFDTSF